MKFHFSTDITQKHSSFVENDLFSRLEQRKINQNIFPLSELKTRKNVDFLAFYAVIFHISTFNPVFIADPFIQVFF